MSFLLITHCRALWWVPQWTRCWNIVIDAATSAAATALRPSLCGTAYVLMHGGFFALKLLKPLHFCALFRVKDLTCSAIYFSATAFEMAFQLNHLYRHGSAPPVLAGAAAFLIVAWVEEGGSLETENICYFYVPDILATPYKR